MVEVTNIFCHDKWKRLESARENKITSEQHFASALREVKFSAKLAKIYKYSKSLVQRIFSGKASTAQYWNMSNTIIVRKPAGITALAQLFFAIPQFPP